LRSQCPLWANSGQTGRLTDQQTAKPENKKLSKIRAVTDVTRILLIAATRARVSALTPEPDTSVTANKIRGSHLEKTLHVLGSVDIPGIICRCFLISWTGVGRVEAKRYVTGWLNWL
jgi:hypothetical protein